MNKLAAHTLAKQLYPLSFLQLIAGMVAVQTYEDPGSIQEPDPSMPVPKPLIKKMPVSDDVYVAEGFTCANQSGLFAMVPDAKFGGMSYFEDRGSRNIVQNRGRYNCTASMRLVVWLNSVMYEMDPIHLHAAAQVKILNALGHQPINDGWISNLILTSKVPVAQSSRIFAEYTYDESRTQFLMLPYVYFAIDLECTFSVSENCINPVTLKENVSCT